MVSVAVRDSITGLDGTKVVRDGSLRGRFDLVRDFVGDYLVDRHLRVESHQAGSHQLAGCGFVVMTLMMVLTAWLLERVWQEVTQPALAFLGGFQFSRGLGEKVVIAIPERGRHIALPYVAFRIQLSPGHPPGGVEARPVASRGPIRPFVPEPGKVLPDTVLFAART